MLKIGAISLTLLMISGAVSADEVKCSSARPCVTVKVMGEHTITLEATTHHMYEAINDGDLEEFKRLAPSLRSDQLIEGLHVAVGSYKNSAKPEGDPGRLLIIKFLLDGVVDVSGTKATDVLQTIVSQSGFNSAAPLLADLMFAHGASASDINIAGALHGMPFPLLKKVLEHGANPNVRSRRNEIPLTTAIYWNNREVFDLLLQYGADVNVNLDSTSPNGNTPYEMASERKNTYMVNALLRAGAKPVAPRLPQK